MLKIEDYCVGCKGLGLPCFGDSCPNKNVKVFQCDSWECGAPAHYDVGGFHMCPDCARDYLRDIFDESTIPELIDLFGCDELKPISEDAV